MLVCALADGIDPCPAFYRDALGLEVTFREGDSCELDGRIALSSRAAHREAFRPSGGAKRFGAGPQTQ